MNKEHTIKRMIVIVVALAIAVMLIACQGEGSDSFAALSETTDQPMQEIVIEPADILQSEDEALPGATDDYYPEDSSEQPIEPSTDSDDDPSEYLSGEEENPEPEENPFNNTELLQHARRAYYSIFFFTENSLYSNGDSPQMPAASVIKVYIMHYAYFLIEQGELSADDFIAGQSVQRLLKQMIQHSDNNATNALIDHFGMERMNQYFREQGFTDTVIQRRMLDNEARNQGLDNYTSTRDVMHFLQRLYHNQMVFPYREMLEIMKGQEVQTKIHLFLPWDTVVASKTGELYDVENDMGIVFTGDEAFAIVVLTDGVHNGAATRQAIGRLALQAYEYRIHP